MGSETRCHFVNPKYTEVDGSPCWPSLDALPERPDTVILAVNPLRAARFTQEAADAGVPSLVIPGGGVVEGGEAAAQMQREVAEIAVRHGMALLGPNCMGMVDWTTNSTNYIGDVNPWLPRGHVAGLAQSGSVTDAFIHSPGTRIGYSRIVSVGSEAVLDLCDYLAYCLDDPETHAVMLFAEGFKRPERFLALADRALAMGKPILAVKVGRSQQAQAAAIAHSGSLAGEDRVTDAAFDAAGVIRCDDLDELLEQAELIAGIGRVGRRVGRGRTGVVTVSTGEASLIADLAERTGLVLPPVPDGAREAILRDLPTMGYIGNPLDPWGAADAPVAYRACFEAMAASGAYDVLAVVHDSPFRDLPSEVEVARDVSTALIAATAARAGPAPRLHLAHRRATSARRSRRRSMRRAGCRCCAVRWRPAWRSRGWPGGSGGMAPGPSMGRGVPGGPPSRPTACRGAQTPRWTRWRARPPARGRAACAAGAGEPRAARRGRHRRDRVPGRRSGRGRRPGRVAGAGRRSAWRSSWTRRTSPTRPRPAAYAWASADEAAIREAVRALVEAAARAGATLRGLLVEPMAAPGVELIVGGRRDAVFGPAVLVGLGGILAEVLDDVAVMLAPVGEAEVRGRLERLRGAPILRGVRGRPGVDLDALASLVSAVGRELVGDPAILEIDLNPVIAGPSGAVAVDALVILETPGA